MHQGHAHECGYQVVVAAIARAIADEIPASCHRPAGRESVR